VPIDVRETDPEGIDYGWIMQTTFVLSIVVGAPLVALLSLFTTLSTWNERATFVIQVGAAVWLVLLIAVYAYARRYRHGDEDDTTSGDETDSEDDG